MNYNYTKSPDIASANSDRNILNLIEKWTGQKPPESRFKNSYKNYNFLLTENKQLFYCKMNLKSFLVQIVFQVTTYGGSGCAWK